MLSAVCHDPWGSLGSLIWRNESSQRPMKELFATINPPGTATKNSADPLVVNALFWNTMGCALFQDPWIVKPLFAFPPLAIEKLKPLIRMTPVADFVTVLFPVKMILV